MGRRRNCDVRAAQVGGPHLRQLLDVDVDVKEGCGRDQHLAAIESGREAAAGRARTRNILVAVVLLVDGSASDPGLATAHASGDSTTTEATKSQHQEEHEHETADSDDDTGGHLGLRRGCVDGTRRV